MLSLLLLTILVDTASLTLDLRHHPPLNNSVVASDHIPVRPDWSNLPSILLAAHVDSIIPSLRFSKLLSIPVSPKVCTIQ